MILGANPFVSNGSLMTAPDMPGRLRALRERGGRIGVVDPPRTKTADEADEWVAIRPGTDAMFLLAIVHALFDEDLVDLGTVGEWVNGLDDVRAIADGFAPEVVAADCAVPAAEIRRLAHDLAAAPTAAVYGRIGTCTQEFGTLASWAVDMDVNETSRHADVILPPPSPLARGHFDVLLYRLGIRNVANYTPPTFDLEPDERHEWDTLLRLGAIAGGVSASTDVADLDGA